MPRAYLPLQSVAYPPPLNFGNGVRVVPRNDFQPSKLVGLDQLFSREEFRDVKEWHLALACNWTEGDLTTKAPPEALLAETRLALQVAAPTGTFLSVCIRELDNSRDPLLMVTRLEQFHGTVWSRMRGFQGMTAPEVESIVNGVIQILGKNDPRTSTPIRLYEQGLISVNQYVKLFLWVSAIDGILMAINKPVFTQRLCRFLGADSRVFPIEDGVHIDRPTSISDIADDLFTLRSEIAHGKPIGKGFWEPRKDLKPLCPLDPYGDSPRYVTLLVEGALSLLSRILRKIILNKLHDEYADVKKWRVRLG